jgi:Uncharacterized conserved protein
MLKVDLKKEYKNFYHASSITPSIVEIPKMNYLKIDGIGSPEGQGFKEAINTLYPIAYTLKFMVRETQNIDYGVMPLEAQWKVNRERKGDFAFTLMLMQPNYVTKELYEEAINRVNRKYDLPNLSRVRYESLEEGLCVQLIHKGDYKLMNQTLDNMLKFISERGYNSERDTHDIYLNNALKTKTENLRTIMRLPVKR